MKDIAESRLVTFPRLALNPPRIADRHISCIVTCFVYRDVRLSIKRYKSKPVSPCLHPVRPLLTKLIKIIMAPEKETPNGSTTVKDVLNKSEFLLKFDLQYSNRATSTTPSQLLAILDEIKTGSKITTVSEIPLSSLRSCVPEM